MSLSLSLSCFVLGKHSTQRVVVRVSASVSGRNTPNSWYSVIVGSKVGRRAAQWGFLRGSLFKHIFTPLFMACRMVRSAFIFTQSPTLSRTLKNGVGVVWVT